MGAQRAGVVFGASFVKLDFPEVFTFSEVKRSKIIAVALKSELLFILRRLRFVAADFAL
jgi:hypothetical protein